MAILLVPRDSQFAREVILPTWKDGLVHGKILEHGHSDVVPAMRYGCIAIRPLLPDPPKDPATDAEATAEAKRERIRRAARKRTKLKWTENESTIDDDLLNDYDALLGTDEF